MSAPSSEYQVSRKKMRAAPIGNASGWFGSAPAISTASRDCSSLKAFEALSRSGGEPALITAEGRHLPPRLRQELQREYQRLELVEAQIKIVEQERDTADAQDPVVDSKRRLLCALHGIGPASAAILSREVFARSFASRRQLGSYLGLTPSAYDSGSTTRCQGISKAGNSWARRVLIEVAWLWRKYQPASPLSEWYARKTADQSPRIRRIMLIALARKLAISLWRYVETGLVPDGAVLAKKAPHQTAAT